mmetsp:Transcript_20260/g.45935  ORF Transcript_20260/g.45935 Transcript_20260/m.45935 type:complete len:327 (+) Transcript_20260:148-1128(+)
MFHDTLSSHIHQLPQRRQYVHGPLPRQRLHSQGRISKLRRPLSIPLQRHPIIGRMRGHVPRERRDLPKPPRLQEHPRHQRRLDPHGSPVWTPPSLRILRPPPQVSQQQLVDGRGQGLGVLRPAIAGGVRRLLLQLAAEGIDDVISVVGAGGAEAGDGHRDGGRDAGGGELVDGGWGGGDLHGGHEVVAEDRGVGAGGAVGSGPYDAVVVGRVDAFAGSVVIVPEARLVHLHRRDVRGTLASEALVRLVASRRRRRCRAEPSSGGEGRRRRATGPRNAEPSMSPGRGVGRGEEGEEEKRHEAGKGGCGHDVRSAMVSAVERAYGVPR